MTLVRPNVPAAIFREFTRNYNTEEILRRGVDCSKPIVRAAHYEDGEYPDRCQRARIVYSMEECSSRVEGCSSDARNVHGAYKGS